MWRWLGLLAALWLTGCMTTGAYSAPATEADFAGFDVPLAARAESGLMDSATPASKASYRNVQNKDADGAPPSTPAAATAERQVIYSAGLDIVVVSLRDAIDAVLAQARQAGGYMQARDSNSVTVRVPAAQFESVLAACEKLGEVTGRSVSADDVTEQVVELELRLDNARRTRDRLVAHLEKSEKIEDTLKIEAELARVTFEIERFEGQLRLLRSRIALSTIHVTFNSRGPQRGGREGLVVPFPWIGRLGDGLVAGAVESLPLKPNILTSGPSFKAPPEFLRYYSNDDLLEAMDASGVRIKIQRQPNFDQGPLSFWSKLARQALVEGRALAVTDERTLEGDRTLLIGSRDVTGERYGYLLLIARTPKRLWTFEAWGPSATFDAQRAALEASALSLKP
jgi:hypothetical protein